MSENNRPAGEMLSAASYELSCLREQLKQDPGETYGGPDYRVQTSSGIWLDVKTVFYDHYYQNKRVRNYLLLGLGPDSKLVAQKSSSIHFEKDNIIAGGQLVTAIRGVGYGTPMEFVHADILQREANSNGKIIWTIADLSMTELIFAQSDYDHNQNEKTRARLDEAIKEHNSFKALYERFGGRFENDQYKPKYHVTLYPDKVDSSPINSVKQVTLKRIAGTSIPVSTQFYESIGEMEKARLKKARAVIKILESSSKYFQVK